MDQLMRLAKNAEARQASVEHPQRPRPIPQSDTQMNRQYNGGIGQPLVLRSGPQSHADASPQSHRGIYRSHPPQRGVQANTQVDSQDSLTESWIDVHREEDSESMATEAIADQTKSPAPRTKTPTQTTNNSLEGIRKDPRTGYVLRWTILSQQPYMDPVTFQKRSILWMRIRSGTDTNDCGRTVVRKGLLPSFNRCGRLLTPQRKKKSKRAGNHAEGIVILGTSRTLVVQCLMINRSLSFLLTFVLAMKTAASLRRSACAAS